MAITVVVTALEPAGEILRYGMTNVSPTSPGGMELQVTQRALDNRKALYAVGTNAEALEKVVREHYLRINGSVPGDLVVQLP